MVNMYLLTCLIVIGSLFNSQFAVIWIDLAKVKLAKLVHVVAYYLALTFVMVSYYWSRIATFVNPM